LLAVEDVAEEDEAEAGANVEGGREKTPGVDVVGITSN